MIILFVAVVRADTAAVQLTATVYVWQLTNVVDRSGREIGLTAMIT